MQTEYCLFVTLGGLRHQDARHRKNFVAYQNSNESSDIIKKSHVWKKCV